MTGIAPQPATVSDHTIYLDGTVWTNTRFIGCTLVFSGGPLPTLIANEYLNCSWRLEGPASNALDFMRFLVNIGGRDIVLGSLGLPIGGGADGFKS
jgi:hypothetical protein